MTAIVIGVVQIPYMILFSGPNARGMRAAEIRGGYREAKILVKGGYAPDAIVVRSDKPARLNVWRKEMAACSDR